MTKNDSFGRWTRATSRSIPEEIVLEVRCFSNARNGAPNTISRTDAILTRRACLRSAGLYNNK